MLMSSARYYILVLLTVIVYAIVSKAIFDKVFQTSLIIVDELFHIPQGLAFCNKNFTYWDPKITTLPGLYLVSSAALGSYFPCTTYNLRMVNLVASCVNLLLFASILKFIYLTNNNVVIMIQALNLVLLPPLYFFSHVYYTDVLSLTFLLVFFRLCLANKHKLLVLVFGTGSILIRQTNVAWIAMVFGHKALDIFLKSSRVFGNAYLAEQMCKRPLIARDLDSSKVRRYYGLSDLSVALKYHMKTCFVTLVRFMTWQEFSMLLTHGTILAGFGVFVHYNGSIVVGDKSAHEPTLHLPQLFYFLLFYGVFGLPFVVARLKSTIRILLRNKFRVILLGGIFTYIVHNNTIVHPYLLADNRHYTFYVWNRWFGKYDFAIYATVPVYIFLLFSLYDNLKDQNCVSFFLPFSISLVLSLALQAMVEVRYFLIPYIILRLRFARMTFRTVLYEHVWYILLNAITFNVFFTKEVEWRDFSYKQRIIW